MIASFLKLIKVNKNTMSATIKVAILENHQIFIDSYVMRLHEVRELEVVGIAYNGKELDGLLSDHHEINVLIMDIQVPTSSKDQNHIFILTYIQKILNLKPNMKILLISMLKVQTLVKALVEEGINGYIFKDDNLSIRNLHVVVKNIARGEKYFSETARSMLEDTSPNPYGLTQRQLEILSICAIYPDLSLDQLALKLDIASSTLRNTLSESYARLKVHNKTAALAQARLLGLIP
jgi:DNA-binding NarL/FixJ family response regulator